MKFLLNQADIQAILPIHGLVIFTKFHNYLVRIMDFSLMSNFWVYCRFLWNTPYVLLVYFWFLKLYSGNHFWKFTLKFFGIFQQKHILLRKVDFLVNIFSIVCRKGYFSPLSSPTGIYCAIKGVFRDAVFSVWEISTLDMFFLLLVSTKLKSPFLRRYL